MQVRTLLTKKEAFESLESRKHFVTRSRGQNIHKVFFSEISTIIQQVVGRWRLRPPPTCGIYFNSTMSIKKKLRINE